MQGKWPHLALSAARKEAQGLVHLWILEATCSSFECVTPARLLGDLKAAGVE